MVGDLTTLELSVTSDGIIPSGLGTTEAAGEDCSEEVQVDVVGAVCVSVTEPRLPGMESELSAIEDGNGGLTSAAIDGGGGLSSKS